MSQPNPPYPPSPGGQGWPPPGGQGVPPSGTQQWPPPQQRSSTGKVLLYMFGGLGLAFLLCCGLCCGTGFWAVQNEHKEVAAKLKTEFGDHPVVVEQLGGLDHIEPDAWAGLNDDEYDMVFNVRGPKGSGTIRVGAFGGEIYEAVLETSGGNWILVDDVEDDEWMPSDEEAMPEIDVPGVTPTSEEPEA